LPLSPNPRCSRSGIDRTQTESCVR